MLRASVKGSVNWKSLEPSRDLYRILMPFNHIRIRKGGQAVDMYTYTRHCMPYIPAWNVRRRLGQSIIYVQPTILTYRGYQ